MNLEIWGSCSSCQRKRGKGATFEAERSAEKEPSMSALRFTKDHEWVRLDGDLAVIGITDYAQSRLGDVVYVELPEIGRQVEQGKEAAIVESVKAASEVYAPVSGEVAEVNDALAAEPAKVNADPMGEGGFMKLRLAEPKQLDALMDEAAYQRFVEEQH
jgi:glycine cleavage system H protein